MAKPNRYPNPDLMHPSASELMREADKFLERLAIGTWTPNVDLCETKDSISVRVELPGVDLADMSVTIQNGLVRIQGIKRERAASQKLLCYYCVERSYRKFQREIRLDWVVEAQRAAATLENGILRVELPKLGDRRGLLIEVPITKK